MKLKYNNQDYFLPDHLSQITLSKWLGERESYSSLSVENLDQINSIVDSSEKQTELNLLKAEKIINTISCYSGIPLEVLKENVSWNEILMIYNAFEQTVMNDTDSLEGPEYLFENEIWYIRPAFKQEDIQSMKSVQYNLLIDYVKRFKRFMDGDMDELLHLCVVHLRKSEDEYPSPAMASDYVRRFKLLPLNIAFAVTRYLTESATLFIAMLNSHLFDSNQ